MKILMLTPYLPYPPASGGQIRTLNLLKYLNKNNHVTLISLYKNEKEKQFASYLKPYCNEVYICKRPEKPWTFNNIFKSIFSFLPFLIVRNYSSEARRTIEHLLKTEHFDVIHAETFYIMPHIPKTTIPILLVEQTIEFKVYQHYISRFATWLKILFSFDILKLKYWETYYWKKATLTAAVSDSDEKILKEIDPTIKTTVIPNGAGDEMFISSNDKPVSEKPSLLFVGNFYWLQNVEAAKFIIDKLLPEVKKEIPNIVITIAGQNAKETFKDISDSSLDIVNIAPDDSDMVKGLYRRSQVFIAPIYGPGGTRLKILAAMASRLPVVSTKTGMEGLETVDGEHVLIANNASEFMQKIKEILLNKNLYKTIQENAFALAVKKYSWAAISKELEIVYQNIKNKDENRN